MTITPNYIRALQSLKIVRRRYWLTVLDIVSFDPFRLVYDDGDYFIVTPIKNFIAGQLTEVELFKV